jgi:hypothetical protein
LKGRCEPGLRCDRLSVESRFDAYHATGMTELVGREAELDLLLRGGRKRKEATVKWWCSLARQA